MSKAGSVRGGGRTAGETESDADHELREGLIPNYIDKQRSPLNSIIIETKRGPELTAICEERRGLRETKRKMKSNACVAQSILITFGKKIQPGFAALPIKTQDALYLQLMEKIAKEANTDVSGLVAHRDETAPHAHGQLVGYNREGTPLTKVMTRQFRRDMQDWMVEIFQPHLPEIERGVRKSVRLAQGDDASKTIHRSVQELHGSLGPEIDAAKAELAKLHDEKATIQQRIDKLLAKEEMTAKQEKNLEAYRRRLDARDEAISAKEAETDRLHEVAENLKATAVAEGRAEGREQAEKWAKKDAALFENTLTLFDQGMKCIHARAYGREFTSEHLPDDAKHNFEKIRQHHKDHEQIAAPTVGDLLFYAARYNPFSCKSRDLLGWVEVATYSLFDRLDKIDAWERDQQNVLKQAKEAAVAEGRAEGRAQVQKDAQRRTEAARLILTGQLLGASISESALHLREAAIDIKKTNQHELNQLHVSPQAKRQSSIWSEAARQYRDRLPEGVWETARNEVKAADEDGREMLDSLPDTDPLVSRAQNLASTLAAYWNRVEAAFKKLFDVRPVHNTSVAYYGTLQNLLPQPLNEHSYLRPLQLAAESELATQDLAEKLQASNDPSPS